MTKTEIVSQIAEKTGVSRKEVAIVVESFMETVKESLLNREHISLRGFGSFIIKHRAEKTARNDVYYTVDGKKGTVRMRQLGNSDRIRLLVEAADMETAKELTAEFERKFELRDIDNTTK